MRPEPDAPRPRRRWLEPGLVLPEGLEAGLIGGFTVVLVYGMWDLALGEPLRTPSLLGSRILFGAGAGAPGVHDAAAAAAYHAVHFAAWVVLGFAVSWAFRAADSAAPAWLLRIGVVAGLLVLVALDSAVSDPRLPSLHLWAGGLAGLVAMAGFLVWRHPRVARPDRD